MESYASGYHVAMKEQIDQILMEQPEYAAVCYQYMKALREGAFDPELVNAIFQEWERHKLNIYDAYLFASIWTSLCYGEILWTSIEISEEPWKDSAHEQNNMVLESLSSKSWVQHNPVRNKINATEVQFRAYFWGSNDIGDGYFEWDQPLSVGVVSPIHGHIEMMAPPTRAPLEVGYTRISTTMYHLNLEECLARWPYNSTSIYIFYCTDKWPRLDGKTFMRTVRALDV